MTTSASGNNEMPLKVKPEKNLTTVDESSLQSHHMTFINISSFITHTRLLHQIGDDSFKCSFFSYMDMQIILLLLDFAFQQNLFYLF